MAKIDSDTLATAARVASECSDDLVVVACELDALGVLIKGRNHKVGSLSKVVGYDIIAAANFDVLSHEIRGIAEKLRA